MPFKIQAFEDNVQSSVVADAWNNLEQMCADFSAATTPLQKARCLHRIMDELDENMDEETRYGIMDACGRCCISAARSKKPGSYGQKHATWMTFYSV